MIHCMEHGRLHSASLRIMCGGSSYTRHRSDRAMVQFVAKFTENKADGQQLETVYNRVKQGKAAGEPSCSCCLQHDGRRLMGV